MMDKIRQYWNLINLLEEEYMRTKKESILEEIEYNKKLLNNLLLT